MTRSSRYTLRLATIVALGGFLMGFDASVVSGIVGFIEPEFALSKLQLGWAVASMTLTATFGMMFAGPLSDRLGRKPVLRIAALLFSISAIVCALAPSLFWLVAGRMLGGFGVGAALIIAPMYIAEVSPAALRGRMVSISQLNIVVGISAAFFSNYLILKFAASAHDWATTFGISANPWRWMLGIELLPALIYLLALHWVPESPRWMMMHGLQERAREIMLRVSGESEGAAEFARLQASISARGASSRPMIAELFSPAMKLVLTIGIIVSVVQQLTGINAVFFYAPMIFEQSGIGTNASFMQAVLVGLVNLAFTIIAIVFIDRIGRRPLLIFGLAGIALSMAVIAWGFSGATYVVDAGMLAALPSTVDSNSLQALAGQVFDSDLAFRDAMTAALGADSWQANQSLLVSEAIRMNPNLILFGILAFVASFAVSLGPVMWVLFSELFPNRLRGLAISLVGLINSAVSFSVQLVFPWELDRFGSATTFLIFALVATVGLVLVLRLFPETRGRSLEEIEADLVGNPAS